MGLHLRLFLLAVFVGCSSPLETETPTQVCEPLKWDTALFPMIEGRTWTYQYEVVESGEQYSAPGPISPPSRHLDAVLNWTLVSTERLGADGQPLSDRACPSETDVYGGRIREVASGQVGLVRRDDRDTLIYTPRDTTWTSEFAVAVTRNRLTVEQYLDSVSPMAVDQFGIGQDTLRLDTTLTAGFGGAHRVELTLNPGEGIGVLRDVDSWRGGSFAKSLALRE